MSEWHPSERGVVVPEESGAPVVVLGMRWGRIASFAGLGILILLAIAIAAVWIDRRPIATHFLKNEFEIKDVTASYYLDRVGFRTQQVSNLVIGDPNHPDLVARHALI